MISLFFFSSEVDNINPQNKNEKHLLLWLTSASMQHFWITVTPDHLSIFMWLSGPISTFKYQGKEVSTHTDLLKQRLPYFYRTLCMHVSTDRDIGFINFHPKSPDRIIDLPVEGFVALLQWAYTRDTSALFQQRNDATYWQRVALVIGVDDLRKQLKRREWTELLNSGIEALKHHTTEEKRLEYMNNSLSLMTWFFFQLWHHWIPWVVQATLLIGNWLVDLAKIAFMISLFILPLYNGPTILSNLATFLQSDKISLKPGGVITNEEYNFIAKVHGDANAARYSANQLKIRQEFDKLINSYLLMANKGLCHFLQKIGVNVTVPV